MSSPHSLGSRLAASLRSRTGGLLLLPMLAMHNRWSSRSVVSPHSDLVVCLTSYGRRLRHVHLVIESIARGRHRPSRLILWLAPADAAMPLSPGLERLQRRGLEVRQCEDFKSHKKYYPFTEVKASDKVVLVTADDDVYYPRAWLGRLAEARAIDPSAMWCYRARRMEFVGERVAPYSQWPLWVGDGPSCRMVPTGVSGVLHPPLLSEEIRNRGTQFMGLAPASDDLWLHFLAVSRRIPVRQVRQKHVHFPLAPNAWAPGLMASNVRGGNDEVIGRLYPEELLQRIVAEERHLGPDAGPTEERHL